MSPTAPDISVVIPVHNGERYLAASIQSVRAIPLAQKQRSWHISLRKNF